MSQVDLRVVRPGPPYDEAAANPIWMRFLEQVAARAGVEPPEGRGLAGWLAQHAADDELWLGKAFIAASGEVAFRISDIRTSMWADRVEVAIDDALLMRALRAGAVREHGANHGRMRSLLRDLRANWTPKAADEPVRRVS